MEHEERLQVIEEISNYSILIDDEYGEYLNGLWAVSDRPDCMSEEFLVAFDKEITHVLGYLKEHAEIVEEIVIPEPHTEFKIVWKDE